MTVDFSFCKPVNCFIHIAEEFNKAKADGEHLHYQQRCLRFLTSGGNQGDLRQIFSISYKHQLG